LGNPDGAGRNPDDVRTRTERARELGSGESAAVLPVGALDGKRAAAMRAVEIEGNVRFSQR
jgi:hypothetical protein